MPAAPVAAVASMILMSMTTRPMTLRPSRNDDRVLISRPPRALTPSHAAHRQYAAGTPSRTRPQKDRFHNLDSHVSIDRTFLIDSYHDEAFDAIVLPEPSSAPGGLNTAP